MESAPPPLLPIFPLEETGPGPWMPGKQGSTGTAAPDTLAPALGDQEPANHAGPASQAAVAELTAGSSAESGGMLQSTESGAPTAPSSPGKASSSDMPAEQPQAMSAASGGASAASPAQSPPAEAAAAQERHSKVPELTMSLTRLPEELPPQLQAEWEVDASLLGEGAYAAVRRVRHRQTGELVALKVVEKYPLLIRNMLPQLQREVGIQSRLQHRNILRLLSYFEDASHVYMLLEYCAGGSLRTLASQMPHNRFAEANAAWFFTQVLFGVDFMHQNGVVHRDLKHDNILLTDQSEVRICDFGWSAEVQVERALRTTCGTPHYWAPEIFEGLPQGPGVDLWALGNLVYELLVGHQPFWGNMEELRFKVLSVDLRYPPGVLSPAAINLFYCFLQRDPSRRVPVWRLLAEHPWILPAVAALASLNLHPEPPPAQPPAHLSGTPMARVTVMCLPSDIPVAMSVSTVGPASFVPPVNPVEREPQDARAPAASGATAGQSSSQSPLGSGSGHLVHGAPGHPVLIDVVPPVGGFSGNLRDAPVAVLTSSGRAGLGAAAAVPSWAPPIVEATVLESGGRAQVCHEASSSSPGLMPELPSSPNVAAPARNSRPQPGPSPASSADPPAAGLQAGSARATSSAMPTLRTTVSACAVVGICGTMGRQEAGVVEEVTNTFCMVDAAAGVTQSGLKPDDERHRRQRARPWRPALATSLLSAQAAVVRDPTTCSHPCEVREAAEHE